MSEQRETTSADMDQAIPHSAGDIAPFDDAQGRLRQGRMGHSKKHHAAAGESGFYLVKRSV
jgi:hypothetical protein